MTTILNIKEAVSEATKQAMRSHNKERLGVLRLIQAAFKQKEVDERVTIDNAMAIVILKKLVKQRKESLVYYTQANRIDLITQEQFELAILNEFLPTSTLTEQEITNEIKKAIEHVQAKSITDLGKTMAYLKERFKDNNVDFQEISTQLKALLHSTMNG